MNEDWRRFARCRGMDPDIFHPNSGMQLDPLAVAACASCRVKDACLQHALLHEDKGYWAGTTGAERRVQRKALGITLQRLEWSPVQREPCGTPGAAKRHRANNEPLDDACQEAWNRFMQPINQDYRARKRAKREEIPAEEKVTQATLF